MVFDFFILFLIYLVRWGGCLGVRGVRIDCVDFFWFSERKVRGFVRELFFVVFRLVLGIGVLVLIFLGVLGVICYKDFFYK